MIVKFTHLGKTIFGTVIDDKNYYKIGEFISIPDGEFDNDCNLLLRNNRKIKDFIFKTYVIKNIVNSFELYYPPDRAMIYFVHSSSLNIELEDMRTYKINKILQLC